MSTREPDRDRAVEQLLRRSLREGGAASRSDLCLDAETLAAWVGRDLKAAEAAAAEAHVSECARCQAMVAALVRAMPAIERRVPWWRRGWVVGSLVPLTAGAIAIVIWMAAPDGARRAPGDRREVHPPAPPASAQAPAPPASAQAQAPPPAAQAPPPAARPEPPRAYAPPSPPPALADRIGGLASETRSAAAARQQAVKEEADKTERRDQAASRPAAPPPPAATETLGARVAPLRENMVLSKQAVATNEILSPDPSVRWRIGPSGSIQHTTNGGATWEPLAASSSGVSEDLTAGAAPSPTTVWVVGRSGTVLLSTDGRRWQRVAFPERTDLLSVRADDALNAAVTTADGRTFRTSDGGRTWSRLQEF